MSRCATTAATNILKYHVDAIDNRGVLQSTPGTTGSDLISIGDSQLGSVELSIFPITEES